MRQAVKPLDLKKLVASSTDDILKKEGILAAQASESLEEVKTPSNIVLLGQARYNEESSKQVEEQEQKKEE